MILGWGLICNILAYDCTYFICIISALSSLRVRTSIKPYWGFTGNKRRLRIVDDYSSTTVLIEVLIVCTETAAVSGPRIAVQAGGVSDVSEWQLMQV